MTIPAAKHFDWCVMRAEQYLAIGDAQQAYTSFLIDMGNHEGTKDRIPPEIAMIGMFEVLNGVDAVRRWIKGFPRP